MSKKSYSWFWFIIAVVIVVWLASADIAFADKRHPVGDDITVTDNSVMENTIKDDNLAVGFSYGMGDVDINEGQNCMGSEQKANILFGRQDLALNPWCAALFYELNGKHRFAAKIRCDIEEISDHYETLVECVDDQDLTPITVEEATDLYDDHREVEQDVMTVQMAQMELEERIEKLEKKPAPRPRVIKQEPEDELTIEEKEAILQLLMKGDEDE